MVLKQTITRNIQNHREVIIDYPPTGLVIFTGQNSNGKSVIVKVTKALLNGDIHKPRKRAGLVNRKAQYGEAIYIRDDDVKLKLHLTREAATTFVTYEEPDSEPITRYLADKSYKELVRRFGWHYDVDSGVSLNIAEADTALLFYKTSSKVNSTILETATSDPAANAVIDKFSGVISEMRGLRDNYNIQIRQYEATINDLKVEDLKPLCDLRDVYEKVYRNLQAFCFPNIPEVKPVPKLKLCEVYIPTIPDVVPIPKIKTCDVYVPSLPVVKWPTLLDVSVNIPDVISIHADILDLKNKVCPTCGRRFVEDAC